jgi:hypothetical protein
MFAWDAVLLLVGLRLSTHIADHQLIRPTSAPAGSGLAHLRRRPVTGASECRASSGSGRRRATSRTVARTRMRRASCGPQPSRTRPGLLNVLLSDQYPGSSRRCRSRPRRRAGLIPSRDDIPCWVPGWRVVVQGAWTTNGAPLCSKQHHRRRPISPRPAPGRVAAWLGRRDAATFALAAPGGD